MNAKRRVNSIARRLRLSWQWKKLAMMLIFDICVLLVSFAAYLYINETAVTGKLHLRGVERYFTAEKEVFSSWTFLKSAHYYFVWEGITHCLNLDSYMRAVRIFGSGFIIFQFLIWILGFLKKNEKTRRILKPLEDFSDIAQKLSVEAIKNPPQDEAKFHDLENAIQQINVGDTLVTGDKELAGIEQAVNDMIARLQTAYRQQAQFVSDASHELRTPIAVIQGYVNMLDRWGKTDEKVLTESIDAIKSETAHMKTLVEQLLFLARGDSGRQQYNPERLNLSDMMRETLEEYRMIDDKHKWAEGIMQDAYVNADPALIKQTARILADNAKRYTPEDGVIRFSTGIHENNCYFQVQDSGVGIAEADVPHIFDRFYRADSARDRASGGTGLGLSIAKWIVEKHKGWFTVTSRQDIGTRIRVYLPQAGEENPQ